MAKLVLLLAFAAVYAAPAEPAPIQRYLNHPSFTWKCDRQSQFRFCWEAGLDADPNLAAARSSAEPARRYILKFAGIDRYDAVIYVFFLKSPERMAELIGYRGEGRSRPTQHAIFFVPTPIRPDLSHELSHEILTNVWGAAESWIEEGFASLVAERGAVLFACLSMTERNTMLPLEKLVRPDWNPSLYSPDITYPELGGFVEFLQLRYGLERVRQVWKQGSVSIPRVFGKSVADLEHDWDRELRREIKLRTAAPGIPPGF